MGQISFKEQDYQKLRRTNKDLFNKIQTYKDALRSRDREVQKWKKVFNEYAEHKDSCSIVLLAEIGRIIKQKNCDCEMSALLRDTRGMKRTT